MKVLVISHNVFGQTNNMGKTLLNYFLNFDKEELCQIYFREDSPTQFEVCGNYFKLTDKDALNTLIKRSNFGKAIDSHSIHKKSDLPSSRKRLARQLKNKLLGHFLRDSVWAFTKWDTGKLYQWLDDMKPDIIFFAQSDFKFAHKIANRIKDYLDVKMVMVCVDDFYLYNRLNKGFFGKMYYNSYMKDVKNTVNRCEFLFTICDSMGQKYSDLFDKECITLMTSAEKRQLKLEDKANKISYIGNLGLGRYKQLIKIGIKLKQLYNQRIEVYSPEIDSFICDQMNDENGIKFNGKINANKVMEVMESSLAVIHVESDEKEFVERTRYSVSTKIAESLMYGPCILAYGPREVESINYLERNKAAIVCCNEKELENGLNVLFNDEVKRKKIIARARKVADENHNLYNNSLKVRQCLEKIIHTD